MTETILVPWRISYVAKTKSFLAVDEARNPERATKDNLACSGSKLEWRILFIWPSLLRSSTLNRELKKRPRLQQRKRHPKTEFELFQTSSPLPYSSNNSRRRFFLFSHQKGAIIRGRRSFQVLFTGSFALNILFYFSIKSKNNHLNETERGLLSVPNLVSWLIFRAWIVTDQFFAAWIRLDVGLILQIYRYGNR